MKKVLNFDEYIIESYVIKKLHGIKIKPKSKVHHTGHFGRTKEILKNGFVPQTGPSYQGHYDETGIETIPAIFAINSTNIKDAYDTTYDDDIWEIDTEKVKVTWYKDVNIGISNAIMTFDHIPPNAIKLVYEGTGEDRL